MNNDCLTAKNIKIYAKNVKKTEDFPLFARSKFPFGTKGWQAKLDGVVPYLPR
jgi:hypothetical protein